VTLAQHGFGVRHRLAVGRSAANRERSEMGNQRPSSGTRKSESLAMKNTLRLEMNRVSAKSTLER